MSILVTVSVNLADSVTLRELRQFIETAQRNGADLDVDLREYDEKRELVGLAAVGQLESDEVGPEGSTPLKVEDTDASEGEDEDVDEDVDEDTAAEAIDEPDPRRS